MLTNYEPGIFPTPIPSVRMVVFCFLVSVIMTTNGCFFVQPDLGGKIYVFGDDSARVAAYLQSKGIQLEVSRAWPLHPDVPTLVKGAQFRNPQAIEALKQMFGGNLNIIESSYENHVYYQHAGLYLKSKKTKNREYWGNCKPEFVEISIRKDHAVVAISTWNGNGYGAETIIRGGLSLVGGEYVLKNESGVNIRFKIAWNSARNAFTAIVNYSSRKGLNGCILTEKSDLLG